MATKRTIALGAGAVAVVIVGLLAATPPAEDGQYVHTNSLVPIYVMGEAGAPLASTVDGVDPTRGPYIRQHGYP
jgi:hypothetical protein